MGVKYTDEQKLLIEGAREGKIEIVQSLIDQGYNVDCGLKYNSSALMIAASRGHDHVVRLLTSVGCKVNRRNRFGLSPFSEAAEHGHFSTVRLLVELGAEVNMLLNNGVTALLSAIVKGDLKMAKLLHDLGGDLDIENFDGWSARKWLLSQSEPAFLEAFGIEKPAPTEAAKRALEEAAKIAAAKPVSSPIGGASQTFWTAFMRAAAAGDLETVRRLADDGIDVNGQSPNGTTALMAALKNGRTETAFELIDLGADLSLSDNDGLSAISWAEKKGLVPFLKLLEDRHLIPEEPKTAHDKDLRVA
jgi:ankyrin repeat protein